MRTRVLDQVRRQGGTIVAEDASSVLAELYGRHVRIAWGQTPPSADDEAVSLIWAVDEQRAVVAADELAHAHADQGASVVIAPSIDAWAILGIWTAR